MNWYIEVLKKYVVFEGRSRRTEFWMFVLINFIIGVVLTLIGKVLGLGTGLYTIYSLAVLVPSIAVAVRRLHDIGRTGWWVLMGFVICIGWIVLIYFYVQDSQPGSNQYGPNPKA